MNEIVGNLIESAVCFDDFECKSHRGDLNEWMAGDLHKKLNLLGGLISRRWLANVTDDVTCRHTSALSLLAAVPHRRRTFSFSADSLIIACFSLCRAAQGHPSPLGGTRGTFFRSFPAENPLKSPRWDLMFI
jgi:hypothetical protein